MILVVIVVGAIVGAISWPIIQRTPDALWRAVFGGVVGGLLGGAFGWAATGTDAGMIFGRAIGANNGPVDDVALGLQLLEVLLRALQGASAGAIVLLVFTSFSRVVNGIVLGGVMGMFVEVTIQIIDAQIALFNLSPGLTAGISIAIIVIGFGVLAVREKGL